jgi:hypothetical protein
MGYRGAGSSTLKSRNSGIFCCPEARHAKAAAYTTSSSKIEQQKASFSIEESTSGVYKGLKILHDGLYFK